MFEQGRPLTAQEHVQLQSYLSPQVLQLARIVDGKVPFWLRRDMCAVVLGETIYFRAGHYRANTTQGACFLGHELTHVAQYLHGMTLFKYIWSCRNGYMQSPYEVQAYAMGTRIAIDIKSSDIESSLA
jgi:Domain of unknown function (DUF4157)